MCTLQYNRLSRQNIFENSKSSNSSWADIPKTEEFFNTILPNGWTELNNMITKICDTIKDVINQNKDAVVLKLTIPIETNTSYLNQDASNYNKNLSERRKSALVKYIKEQIKNQISDFDVNKIQFNGSVKKYQENANSLDQGSVVETPTVDLTNTTNKIQLNDEDNPRSIYAKEAYLYRYAVINGAGVKIEYTDGTVTNLADKINKDNAVLQNKLDYYNSLFKKF